MAEPTTAEQFCEDAIAARPGLVANPEAFRAHLHALVDDLDAAQRSALHGADLAIAFACAERAPEALAIFEREYAPAIRAVLRKRGSDEAHVDDLLQEVRHHLLLTEPPRILAYGGRGPLGAWLRVVALRLTASEARRHWREQPLEDAMLAPATAIADPLQAERSKLLREVLREATAALTKQQRAVMRLYYVDDVGVEDLGRMFRVHASTISRWLAHARTEILHHARAALTRVASTGVESLLGHAATLDVDLESLLRTVEPPAR